MRTDEGKAKPQNSVGRECCILCGKLTGTAKEQPVLERRHYIEGAGQLCQECYQELYVPQHNQNMVRLACRGMEEEDGRHKA